MDLIRTSIERPVAVIAAVLMVIMFGLVALDSIPIQLTPDVRKPIINLRTIWAGAAPAEVEREITNRQEETLKGLEGLEEISSRSEDGQSSITLEFAVGQNMDKAMLLVSNRLDRVGGYPSEVDQPTIRTSSSEDSPITWIILRRAPGNERTVHKFGDFVEDTVQDRIERVRGVSRVNVYGGSERELKIVVDPDRMARFGLTVTSVVITLRAANASVTAGDVDEGKRRYVVRTEGEFETINQVKDVVLRSLSDQASGRLARVTMGDIAEVSFTYKDPTSMIRFLGEPAMAINAVRETGANVIEVMDGIRVAIDELNAGILPENGLYLTQVYDETVYIDSSIDLVQQNIFVGGALAAMILLLFLRSGRATLVISLAIPVSVIGAFVAMAALGRSLNVISLAGIAFAVGMVVDAAIVVLENIYRLHQQGKSKREAAYLGAQQVWGAVFVSALTTVLVFIPILIMDLEVGQLFRDIAVAISVSVILSLIVAITVIPALSNRLLNDTTRQKGGFIFGVTKPLATLGAKFVHLIVRLTKHVITNRARSMAMVAILCGTGAVVTYLFLPKLDYLPTGNRNLILGVVLPPPGYNLETTSEIATRIESEISPLWQGSDGTLAHEQNGTTNSDPDQPAKVQRFFFVAWRGTTILGAAAADPSRVKDLIPVLSNAVYKEPGTFGLISQRSLFARGIGGGRSIDLNVTGPSLEDILETAHRAYGKISGVLPQSEGTQIRPKPGLELGAPEIRVIPNRIKLADNGVTARELGDTLDAFNDGLRVAEITVDNKRMDLTLAGPDNGVIETQGIANLPVVTSDGKILPASSLADISVTSGPIEIRHLERQRTVTLQIRPPDNMALESVLDILEADVVDALKAEGLPDGVRLRMSGTADKLSQTWDAMVLDLLIAVVIVYLAMAVLFESFVYPLVIMLSVPLATAGGIGGLALVNMVTFQPLDMLTLLGFVILIGIVVNNAILLVHQTLFHLRDEGMSPHDAIMEATRNRIRPIFMSTLTSVFGMVPLVVFPGAGSELYRGLGSVVVGGLSLSALLTLLIIPPLLALIIRRTEAPVPSTAPAE
ncbi:MAG: efflux RND transporter permease subunit [Rhodospirillales bacterium]|nr:efflux RND transporter permease subunit [Rhodospirillales bacterium]